MAAPRTNDALSTVVAVAGVLAAAGLFLALPRPLFAAPPSDDQLQVVGAQELLAAMREEQGYDPTATTNGARFQAEVLLRLARQAKARDPKGPPLLVGHEDWYRAFLQVTGCAAETAPLYAQLAYQHGQDMVVDYRDGRVVRKVEKGPRPQLAANVVIRWPERPGAANRYSYRDTLSVPRLKVTNARVITYRLLDFGDMVVYDEIEGLTGRPTSGLLGLLFRAIGEGRVVQSRMAISRDGLQVSRARSKKAFLGVTATATVFPDGRSQKDVPEDRPDLLALERQLRRDLDIEYVPLAVCDEQP